MDSNFKKSCSRNRVKKHRAIRKMCTAEITEILRRVADGYQTSHTVASKNDNAEKVSAVGDTGDTEKTALHIEQALQGADVHGGSAIGVATDIGTEMRINTHDEDVHDESDISTATDIDEEGINIHQEAEVTYPQSQAEPTYNSNESAESEEDVIDELRHWAIVANIQQNHLDKLLKILRRKLIPSLPKSSKTLLETSSASYCITEMQDAGIANSPGQFAYLGIEEGLKHCINSKIHQGTIELIFNVDGLPISNSSGKCFWPILCKPHYIPDIYNPFPVAIYLGMSKPKNLENYLKQFIQEINNLQEHGVAISGKRYQVKLKCFVADTPARAFLKCCKCHGGYSACERCVVRGKSERTGRGSTVSYSGVHHQRRTNESFRRQEDPDHHTGISPLLEIKPHPDMVTLFLLDLMHLILGIAKKMIGFWMYGPLDVRLSPSQKQELSRRLLSLQRQIPSEFQRKPRSIFEFLKWKATEFRFFVLYCGPVVLKSILPSNLYKHFLLLHVALRILSSDELCLTHNAVAKRCLRKFVLVLPLLYGPASVVINMHNLVHLADDAINMGCSLTRVNCFPFESALGALKKKLRTPNKPLAQICRRYQEKNSLKRDPQLSLPPVIQIHKSCRENEITIVHSLKFHSMLLSNSTPNNLVFLENGIVMQINKIWNKGPALSSIIIQGKIWLGKKPLYDYPANSQDFGMWELQKPLAVSVTYPLTKVKQKLVRLDLSFQRSGLKRLFVALMLHT